MHLEGIGNAKGLVCRGIGRKRHRTMKATADTVSRRVSFPGRLRPLDQIPERRCRTYQFILQFVDLRALRAHVVSSKKKASGDGLLYASSIRAAERSPRPKAGGSVGAERSVPLSFRLARCPPLWSRSGVHPCEWTQFRPPD